MENKNLIDKIHREMLLELDDKFDKSTGSFAYDILKPPAIELLKLLQAVDLVDSKRNIYNLTGEELELFIAQFTPITRNPATYAHGEVQITGTAGATVEKHTLVASISHNYKVTQGGKLDAEGKGIFPVVCVTLGKKGNADIGVVNHFPVSVNGLDAVTNLDPIIDGFDIEDDDSLRDRYFAYINLPATSGNRYHYLYWAKQITGVGLVRVHSLWDGDNTVKLIITDANGNPASEELIKEVQDYIDPIGGLIDEDKGYTKWGRGFGEAPVGAFCTVVSAESVPIKIEAKLKIVDGYTIEEITNEFKTKMNNRFSVIALDEGYNTISLARIGCIILGLKGVEDYDATSLKINGQQENIVLTEEQVGVFDEVVFDEI